MEPLPHLQNERELLLRLSRGDERAFEAIFSHYYPILFTYINKLTGASAETESILQDIFTKLWVERQSITKVENFKPWLLVSARNRTRNALRSMMRRSLAEAGLAALPADDSTADDLRIKENRIRMIDEAVENLPPKFQEVWILNRKEKQKQAEIAAKLGLSLPTVKKYMQQSVEFIRNYVNEHNPVSLFILTYLALN